MAITAQDLINGKITATPTTISQGQLKQDVSSGNLQVNSDPSGFLSTPSTGGSGGGSSAPAVPALTAAQIQAKTDFATGQGTANGLINSNISGQAGGYQNSILDYLSGLKQQQNTINGESTQNELAREQGHQGVLDMVGNGIKSGGVVLANDNAGSSSAGDALARAYATLGRQQESSVGNQFVQGQNKITTEQTNLDQANSDEVRHASQSKVDTINSIVNDATTKLSSLNQLAMYASIPDRVDIDAQIAEIKQQAMDALSVYDQSLTQGIASNAPASADQTRAQASQLLTAGVAPQNEFSYTADVPAQLQNTGPFASPLPIFTAPKKNQNA